MWNQAIETMKNDGQLSYGPKSFIEYCKENGLRNSGTANYISIDYFEKLHKELRDEKLMVFRLGSENKKAGTDFMLISYENPEEFFFFDELLFTGQATMYFPDPVVKNALSIMKIFSNYSEMMLVSYLLSSGVLSDVLGFDKTQVYYTPLTGRNNYSFDFYANDKSGLLIHRNGQVEIDAVFSGFRNGKPVVVVAEAKVENGTYKTLAKHKLFYAYKSIQSVLEDEFEIIPIYLKLSVNDHVLTAKIAVCRDVGNDLSRFEVVDSGVVEIEL